MLHPALPTLSALPTDCAVQPLWQHFDIVARLLQFMRVINFTNGLQAGGRRRGVVETKQEINLCNLEFAK